MQKKILFFSCVFIYTITTGQVIIHPSIYSQNAWFIDVGDGNVTTFATAFTDQLTAVEESGVRYMRIGGIDPNFYPLFNFNPGDQSITGGGRLIYLINQIRKLSVVN